jgi:tetratricopeptide (TPR) repeat protein
MGNGKAGPALHFGIAERGKMYQLEGNYKEALRHYREAIRMTQGQENGEIFFQHYSQCVMEALELSGAQGEVVDYCDRFLDFLEAKEQTDLVKKHRAIILEKQGIQQLLKGEIKEAGVLLKEAQQIVGKGSQPLTDELLNWALRGYQISKKQVQDLQKKHLYFIVRKDKVNPSLAIDLPEGVAAF